MSKLLKISLFIFTLFYISCGSPFYDPAYINSAFLINKMDLRGKLIGFNDYITMNNVQEELFMLTGGVLPDSNNPDKYASFINKGIEVYFETDSNSEYSLIGTSNFMTKGIVDNNGKQNMIIFPLVDQSLIMPKGYIVAKKNEPPIPTDRFPVLGYSYTNLDIVTPARILGWSWDQDGDNGWTDGTDSTALDDSIPSMLITSNDDKHIHAMNTTQLNSGDRTLQLLVQDFSNPSILYELNQLLPPASTVINGSTTQSSTTITTLNENWFINKVNGVAYGAFYAHDSINQRSVLSIETPGLDKSYQTLIWSTKGSSPSGEDEIINFYNAPPRAHVAASLSTGDILFLSGAYGDDGHILFSLFLLDGMNTLKRLNCGYMAYVSESIIDGVPTCIFNMAVEEYNKEDKISNYYVYTIPTEELLKLF